MTTINFRLLQDFDSVSRPLGVGRARRPRRFWAQFEPRLAEKADVEAMSWRYLGVVQAVLNFPTLVRRDRRCDVVW
jgi:hypothetical protein